jgi:hypothetical protein
MTDHPIYLADLSVNMLVRPCAANPAEGSCEDAARQIGVDPQSPWTSPHSGTYGWACSAHEHVMLAKYQPERKAALDAQLEQEGREFWDTYGEESSETPHISRRRRALDSLNSDT